MPFDGSARMGGFILPAHAGAWWKGHEAELVEALDVALVAAPHLASLAHTLLPRFPRRVLASSSIKGAGARPSSRMMPLAEALTQQWVSFNGRDFINTETADIDDPMEWRSTLQEMSDRHGLPLPALMVASPWKGTVHLLWIYAAPIARRSAAAMRLRRGIKRGLVMLGACPRFANTLQKNPWHTAATPIDTGAGGMCGDPAIWERYQAERSGLTYHTEIWSLRTVQGRDLFSPLADAATERMITLLETKVEDRVGRQMPVGVIDDLPDRPGSRLFLASSRAVRHARTGDGTIIRDIVARTAAAVGSPASQSQIGGIAASITEWMNTKWRGPLDGRTSRRGRAAARPIHTGVMKSEAADRGPQGLRAWRSLDVTEKRRAAARRTNGQRILKSDQAIRVALAAMVREGEDITQEAVAARAQVSVRSVQRRWKTLEVPPLERTPSPPHGLIRLCGDLPSSISIPHKHGSAVQPTLLVTVAGQVRQAQKIHRRSDRQHIRRYRAQAARMRRRGAHDEAVATIPANTGAALRATYADACQAQFDVRRRMAGRQQRERQLRNAHERTSWHTANALNDDAWIERLKRISLAREEAVERARARNRTTEPFERMFGSIFGAEYRARRLALGEPPQNAQDCHRTRQGSPRVKPKQSPSPSVRKRPHTPERPFVPFVMPRFAQHWFSAISLSPRSPVIPAR